MLVLVDSTVLIALSVVEQAALLPAFYGSVGVTQAVWQEVVLVRPGRPGADVAEEAFQAGWLKRWPDPAGTVAAPLGPGETTTLLLALVRQQAGDDVLVLMDEPRARSEAKRLGLPVRGVLGLLLQAKQQGGIPALRPLLDRLDKAGFYVHPRLKADMLKLAQE